MAMENSGNGKVIPGQYIVTISDEVISERVKMAGNYAEKQTSMAQEANQY